MVALAEIPDESKQLQKEARNRFQRGVSLNGREIRKLFPELVLSHYHLCFVVMLLLYVFCHVTSPGSSRSFYRI